MQEINIYLKGKGYSKEAGYTYDPKQKQINGKGYGLFQLDAKREDYNWMAGKIVLQKTIAVDRTFIECTRLDKG